MKTIRRGIAGLALAAGLALTGGVAAHADDGVAAVAEQGTGCYAEFSAKDRRDGMFEYRLGITCERLERGVQARAVVTFENADGSLRKVPTPWVTRAPGSESIGVVTAGKAIDVHIERRTGADG